MKKDFNNFRFAGFNFRSDSNKYFTMDRMNGEENRVIVRVGFNHLIKTQFGFAFVLDQYNVVFIKEWQVSQSPQGCEVLLTKDFFNVKKWGNHELFGGEKKELHSFDFWVNVAKEQINTPVWWLKVKKVEDYLN